MKYYLSHWNPSKFESKTIIKTDEVNNLFRFVRCYDGKEAVFYTETNLIFRDMYVYVGDFLQKTVLSYIEIQSKCSDKSIKAAFENCPHLYEWLNSFYNDDYSPIFVLKIQGEEYYCLKETYTTLFVSKKRKFNSLCNKAEVLRKEIPLIKTYLLEPSFWQKTKKFFAKSTKYALKFVVRAGVVVAASAIGANIDLPDFDFDLDIPDTNTDFGIDLDVLSLDSDVSADSESSDVFLGYDNIDDSNNFDAFDRDISPYGNALSFGSQDATLHQCSGGLKTVDVTITKEPGSSNMFCISDGRNTYHNIKGGTSKLKIDGILYSLPKLKG